MAAPASWRFSVRSGPGGCSDHAGEAVYPGYGLEGLGTLVAMGGAPQRKEGRANETLIDRSSRAGTQR